MAKGFLKQIKRQFGKESISHTVNSIKMKRIIFIAICIASSQYLLAQEPADALRFSWSASSGTARQLAIGGAGGSLGGDISAAYINPAGLGFYKTGDVVFTPGYNFLNNKSNYFNHTEKDKSKGVSFGTSGFVMGAPSNNRNGGTRSSAFSLTVNRTANFNSHIL